MNQTPEIGSMAEDIDLRALGRALWRAKSWILGLAAIAGILTFLGLSLVRAQYTSESRILIENDVSPFARAATDQAREPAQTLDEQAIQSQVQVLTSRDLALQVATELDLANNPEFAKDAAPNFLTRLLDRLGIGHGVKSELERAADAFEEHLQVFALGKSSVIAIDYTSGDPALAAAAANKLAEVYLDWQRQAKLSQTKDATAWLNAQIDELRGKVSDSEAAVEQFRSTHGLFQGSNNVNLNAQQLSELNSQLILAKAQRSEAEARARLIKKMLEDKIDIDATPEVLKSELIGRLIEQRVQVQRQLAELSATLLPSHPRMKQLTSELADVRSQIRDEANKIVQGLENEEQIAAARETSLSNSLNEAQGQASGQSDAEIKLRALEREAKANRDLLESYLARYRDASARQDMGAVPANATIVSRAHPATKPSFPKRGPLSALAAGATALLALTFVFARALIGGGQAAAPVETPKKRLARRHDKADRTPANAEQSALATAYRTGPAPLSPRGSGEVPAAAMPPGQDDAIARSAPQKALKQAGREDELEERPAPFAASVAAAKGLVDRMRRNPQAAEDNDGRVDAAQNDDTPPAPDSSAPNDLRSYLRRRAALNARQAERPRSEGDEAAPGRNGGPVGPVLTSLSTVLNHMRASGGSNGHVVLTVPVSPDIDIGDEAIRLGRGLVSHKRSAVLVDLARGPSSLSSVLGLPRAPGFTDLCAGRASFADVLHVDDESQLQLVTAGSAGAGAAHGYDTTRVARIFEALAQAYDSVLLHADAESALWLKPALAGGLRMIVAVQASGASGRGEAKRLEELAAFGCEITRFEQEDDGGRRAKPGLLGRPAAVS